MVVSEAEKQGGARRWLGYTCPECHAIFRVPTAGRGKVAQCPHCLLPIRLGGNGPGGHPAPAGGTETAVQDETEKLPDGWVRSERSGRLKKKRRVTRKPGREEPDWESGATEGQAGVAGPRFFLVLLCGLLLLTAGVGVFMKRLMEAQDEKVQAIKLEAPPVESVGEGPAEEEGDPLVAVIEGIDVPAIREAVATFLRAESVEDLLATVRDPGRVEPAIRAYYADRPLRPVAYREIAPEGEMQAKGSLAATTVVLDDFSERAVAVERTGEGHRVDWESWVGHGEMSWSELRRRRPTRPVLMRVEVWELDYYNFDFSDESRWKSFRLTSGDERTIYGYAPAGSEIEQELSRTQHRRKGRPMTVTLRYPEGATRDEQVIIDKVVASGWVARE